jgi:hypothetical protein
LAAGKPISYKLEAAVNLTWSNLRLSGL